MIKLGCDGVLAKGLAGKRCDECLSQIMIIQRFQQSKLTVLSTLISVLCNFNNRVVDSASLIFRVDLNQV